MISSIGSFCREELAYLLWDTFVSFNPIRVSKLWSVDDSQSVWNCEPLLMVNGVGGDPFCLTFILVPVRVFLRLSNQYQPEVVGPFNTRHVVHHSIKKRRLSCPSVSDQENYLFLTPKVLWPISILLIFISSSSKDNSTSGA